MGGGGLIRNAFNPEAFWIFQGDICICLNANVAIAANLCRENSREASLRPAPSATSSPRRSRPAPDADAPTPATLKKQKQSSTARFSQEWGQGGGRSAVRRRPGYFPDGLQSAGPPVRRRGVELYTCGATEQRLHRPPAVLQHGALAGWAGRGGAGATSRRPPKALPTAHDRCAARGSWPSPPRCTAAPEAAAKAVEAGSAGEGGSATGRHEAAGI